MAVAVAIVTFLVPGGGDRRERIEWVYLLTQCGSEKRMNDYECLAGVCWDEILLAVPVCWVVGRSGAWRRPEA